MKKVNIGVIGTGAIARVHIPALKSLEEKCQIVAICDVNEGALKFWGDRLKLPDEKRYKNYQELINDPLVEIVDILLPNQFHRDTAVAAANAGKHVIVEKPIARTLEETNDIIKAAEKNSVKLMSAHNRRYCRTFSLAKQAMAKIGKPYAVSCEWRFYYPYEVTRGFRANKDLSGGGVVIDNGWHAVDLIRWYVGEISEVFGYWSQMGLGGLSTGEDTLLCLFRHQNGALSQLLFSWGPGPAKSDIIIYGLGGTVAVNPTTYQLYRPKSFEEGWGLEGRHSLFPNADPMTIEKLEVSPLDIGWGWAGFPEMLADFIDSIITNKPVPIPAEEGKKILQIILATYESAEKGIVVKIY
jgi:predicted dehydrogenase